MTIRYKPFGQRLLNHEYRNLLRLILEKGEDVDSQQDTRARRFIGAQMRFDLTEGFPLITERDLSGGDRSVFRQALAEMRAFWLKGARTLNELKAEGCYFWDPWGTPEKCAKRGLEPGDLGPGSYGPALRFFPTETGDSFDQVQHILEQMQQMPHLRTHFISPWIPQFIVRGTDAQGKPKQQRVVVAPCHGWVHIFLNQKTKELKLHHFQRSGDVPVGVPCNMVAYGALAMMFAQILGYTATELIHTISDAHIYHGQISYVQEMLNTSPMPLPTVTLDPMITNFFEFKPEHFTLQDYFPTLGRRRIWTPV